MHQNDISDSEYEITIDLRDRNLAALLAWLVPGAGHMYQGRWGKGLLFTICILGTFVFGMYLGEGNVVYASWGEDPNQRRLAYVLQIGVGAPALPALVQANFESRPLGDFMAPPEFPLNKWGFEGETTTDEHGHSVTRWDHDELAQWYRRIDGFELGTVYTMIAGLLNILAIYDAWGGPVFATERRKEDEDEDESPTDDADENSRSEILP